MSTIPRIQIPSPVVREVPRPVVQDTPRPVVSGLSVPVVDVPNPVINYPTIDVPTEEKFRGEMGSQQSQESSEPEDTRDLPTTDIKTEQPTITIGGVEAPLPEPAPLITAGATAVVTTTVTLGATILVGKLKETVLEPMMKRMNRPKKDKKKKIKIKQVKPVLHYILNDEGKVDILQYSQKGTKVVGQTDDVERYIRDQVEDDSLYEMDNKIIIDDVIKDKFTKEGAKRFKSLFAPAKSIAKKLSAKFSI